MASTTYRYLGGVTAMFAAQEQFRDITKMVTKCHRFAVIWSEGLHDQTFLDRCCLWRRLV